LGPRLLPTDEADEGSGGPGIAVEEAGEGGGELGGAVLGPGFAVALEEKEEESFEGCISLRGTG
jgi:hypothetical protein